MIAISQITRDHISRSPSNLHLKADLVENMVFVIIATNYLTCRVRNAQIIFHSSVFFLLKQIQLVYLMSPCLLSQIHLKIPTVRQRKHLFLRDSQHKYTVDSNLLSVFLFPPDLLVNGEVPTPAVAVEGEGMPIDRFGKYSVYFCLVVSCGSTAFR